MSERTFNLTAIFSNHLTDVGVGKMKEVVRPKR